MEHLPIAGFLGLAEMETAEAAVIPRMMTLEKNGFGCPNVGQMLFL